jgi:hypothetical protein
MQKSLPLANEKLTVIHFPFYNSSFSSGIVLLALSSEILMKVTLSSEKLT